MDWVALVDFSGACVRLSIPVAFAAVGGVLCERSGVFNIALEGCILAGAFGAALGAALSGYPAVGVGSGLLFGFVVGLMLAVLAVSLGANQLVSGIAINVLTLGATSFLARLLLPADMARDLPGFQPLPLPYLSDIPLIGPVFFAQDALTYLLYMATLILWFVLAKTPMGLFVRAVGDNPRAADSAGVNVSVLRFSSVLAGCAIASMGGVWLVLSQVHIFTEHMSAGKGFIAVAAVILGRWNPVGALLASLLFGAADAFQLQMQFNRPDVPYQLFSTLPFVAALFALIFLTGRAKPPAAGGVKYRRDGK
ncbi:ABC transporter permease [Alphaproteobacteria bacterium]|nr:ABC transporter permease [Alphaproteobacteria bacterium]